MDGRNHLQWFSVEHVAWMLDLSASTVRQYLREGRFQPANEALPADRYVVQIGTGRGADVRISSLGLACFFQFHTTPYAPQPIRARSVGELKRKLEVNAA